MVFAGSNHEIIGLGLLHYQPHALHIIFGIAPVAVGVEVAEVELILQSVGNASCCNSDFSSHESLAASLAFVVEENTIHGIHSIAFAIVFRNPESIELCAGVWAARIERSTLVLRYFLNLSIKLGGACLIYFRNFFALQYSHGFEKSQSAHSIGIGSVFGHIKRNFHVALSGKIIYFVGLNFLDYSNQRAGVGHIAVMEIDEAFPLHVAHPFIEIKMLNAPCVERAASANDAMHFVALFEQKFG